MLPIYCNIVHVALVIPSSHKIILPNLTAFPDLHSKIYLHMAELIIVGGGLSGCEAAWQAASRGIQVCLYEMRPHSQTGAHTSAYLSELVCSNSLGSCLVDRASGLLKEEIKRLGSLLIQCAEETALPAGNALAVDRERFAARVTQEIESHPNIRVIRQEIQQVPEKPVVIASGPLTSESLSDALQVLTGRNHLFFYDAIAPVIDVASIDMSIAYRASRYSRGELDEGDYINCPLSKDMYENFIDALVLAERGKLKDFENNIERGVTVGAHRYFEGCLPIEILAQRSRSALAFGPLRPVGLRDPRTGRAPYAVVQLRQDNQAGTFYNMVGFQTTLLEHEQRRVFRLIPGLEKAEFERYGQMHRNTFLFAPEQIYPTLQHKEKEYIFFAGQIIGVEGYIGNMGTGLLAGVNAARYLRGEELVRLPVTTMLGSLCEYITHAGKIEFQPMKANFGILPPLEGEAIYGKRERGFAYAQRSLADLKEWMINHDIDIPIR